MRRYLARVLIMELEEFIDLDDCQVLDVGGARGEFCQVLHQLRGCRATNVDPDPGIPLWPDTVRCFADDIPLASNRFDLVICRGVLEHIPTVRQQASIREMFRVTRPGGLCYFLIPPWFNPHAGHTLKPFHVLPFKAARFLRQLWFRESIPARSYAEAGLYPITFRRMLRLISGAGMRLLATRDSHFRLHFMTRIPVLRELLVPSAAFILKKPPQTADRNEDDSPLPGAHAVRHEPDTPAQSTDTPPLPQ